MAIVSEVEPDNVFVVEDCFDSLAEDWHRARSQDEGRFEDGLVATTFAAVVVPFLFSFFGDVLKDIVKDQAKKAAGRLIENLLQRKASNEEVASVEAEIYQAIDRSRFSADEKTTLRNGFTTLFAKLGQHS